MKKKFLSSKRARYGAIVMGTTSFIVIGLILFNIIIAMLSTKFNWNFDVTSAQAYHISDTTASYLSNYEEEVTIYVLEDEQVFKTQSNLTTQAYHVLKDIQSLNNKIQLSYVDLDKHPEFYQQYASESLASNGILVVDRANGRYQYLAYADLFDVSSSSGDYQVSSLVEQKTARALEYVAGTNPIHMTLVQGHEELDLNDLSSYFKQNNYEYDTVNLLTQAIPDDTDILLIAAPTTDYTKDDVQKLENFLNQNGNLGKTIAYFGSGTDAPLPNLDEFLYKWGIKIGDGCLLETDRNRIYRSPYMPYIDAQDSKYTENMADQKLPIFAPYMQKMEAGTPDDSTITVTPFATTSDTCTVRPSNADENWTYDEKGLTKYPVALAAEKTDTEKKTSSCVLAYASVHILGSMDQRSMGNGDFILSSFGVAANKPSAVNVSPKLLSAPVLPLTAAQISMFGTIFIFLLPLCFLIIGVLVWMHRREK